MKKQNYLKGLLAFLLLMVGATPCHAGDFIDDATSITIKHSGASDAESITPETVDDKKVLKFTPTTTADVYIEFNFNSKTITPGQTFGIIEMTNAAATANKVRFRYITIGETALEEGNAGSFVTTTESSKTVFLCNYMQNANSTADKVISTYYASHVDDATLNVKKVGIYVVPNEANTEVVISRVDVSTLGAALKDYSSFCTSHDWQYVKVSDIRVEQNGTGGNTIKIKNTEGGACTAAQAKLFALSLGLADMPAAYTTLALGNLVPSAAVTTDIFANVGTRTLKLNHEIMHLLPTMAAKLEDSNSTVFYRYLDGVDPSTVTPSPNSSDQWAVYSCQLVEGYNSVVMPFKKLAGENYLPSGITFYKADNFSNGSVTFIKQEDTWTNNVFTDGSSWTPYIIKAEAAGIYNFVGRDGNLTESLTGLKAKNVGAESTRIKWIGSFANEAPSGDYAAGENSVNYSVGASNFAKMANEDVVAYYRAFLSDKREGITSRLETPVIADDGSTITLTLNKVASSVTTPPEGATGLTYDGSAKKIVNATNAACTGGTLVYSKTQEGEYGDASTITETNAGTYSFWYKVQGDATHTDSTPVEVTGISIAKAQLSSLAINITGWTVGASANAPEVTGNSGSGAQTITYKVKDADDATYSETVPTVAGNYTVRVSVVETTNYLAGSATADFTITAAPTYAITKAGTTNGSFTLSAESASSGTEVTITTNPSDGYKVGLVTVTDSESGSVDVTTVTENSSYKFTMPAKAVTVNVSFVETVSKPVYIGETGYDNLAAAIDAATDNTETTIIIKQNITVSEIKFDNNNNTNKCVKIVADADNITIKSVTTSRLFTVNSSTASLKIGSDDHTLIIDGDNEEYSQGFISIENDKQSDSNTEFLTNVTIKNVKATGSGGNGYVYQKKNGGHSKMVFKNVTFDNCSVTGTSGTEAIVRYLRQATLYLSGYINFNTNCSGTSVYLDHSSCVLRNSSSTLTDLTITNPITVELGSNFTSSETKNINNNVLVLFSQSAANNVSLKNTNRGLERKSNGDVKLREAFTLAVPSTQYATIVLPYAATIPSGVKVQTLTTDSKKYVIAADADDTTIAKQTPKVVKAAEGSYKFVSTEETAASNPESVSTVASLTGVYTATTATAGTYLLDGATFKKAAGTESVTANSAYLTVEGATANNMQIGASADAFHTITVTAPSNGTVTISHEAATNGTVVTVTATPELGYTLSTLTAGETDIKEAGQFTMGDANITVTATFATTANVTIGENGYSTLKAAVDAATDGATININNNTTETEQITFTKNLTIVPTADVTVTRATSMGDAAMFNIGANVTIGDASHTITIDGQQTAFNTQLITGTAGTLSLVNTTFKDVYSSHAHGLVFAKDTKVSLNGVTFNSCQATATNAGIFFVGKNDAVELQGTNTFTGCTGYNFYLEARIKVVDGITNPTTPYTLFINEIKFSDGSIVVLYADKNDYAAPHFSIVNAGYNLNAVDNSEKKEVKIAKIPYTVTSADGITNGSLQFSIDGENFSASLNNATIGNTITVKSTPASTDYYLSALSYNDGTDHVIDISGATYTFTMPASNVTVNATYQLMATGNVVNTTTNTGYSTLAEAVAAANANDVIILKADQTLSTAISFDKSLTIAPATAAVTLTLGEGVKFTLATADKTVTFGNATYPLTIAGSATELTSQMTEVTNGTINFVNTTISNVVTSNAQGVLCAKTNGVITLKDVTFNGCKATATNAGILFSGKDDGIKIQGAITFTGCTGYNFFLEKRIKVINTVTTTGLTLYAKEADGGVVTTLTNNSNKSIAVVYDNASYHNVNLFALQNTGYTLSLDNKDLLIAPKSFGITIPTTIENGTLTVDAADATTVAVGTEVTITATANSGYQLKSGSLAGTYGADNKSLTITDNKFKMPAGAVTLTAQFISTTVTTTGKSIVVMKRENVNGGTRKYADDSKTVAATNANDAIWYLGDVDMTKVHSITVKGAAFQTGTVNEVITKPDLKIGYLPAGTIASVSSEALSTNSPEIRSAGKLMAQITAATTPTTVAEGNDATNYPGADFEIKADGVAQIGTYDGTVDFDATNSKGLQKMDATYQLFLYGTASSRRLAVDEVIINYLGSNIPEGAYADNTYEEPMTNVGQDTEVIGDAPSGYVKATLGASADTYLRKGNTANNGSKPQTEIYTYKDDTDDLDFVGLYAFELPERAKTEGAEIQKVQLRLVGKRTKGSRNMKIYGFDTDFNENAKYEELASAVEAARASTTLAHAFETRGQLGLDIETDATSLTSYNATIAGWTNYIDLTAYAKSLEGTSLRIMVASPDNSKEQKMYYTKEATGISNDVMTVEASDLVPQLVVVYKQGAETFSGTHPLLLHTAADIARVKANLNYSPMKEAYEHLQQSSYAQTSYTASPVEYLKRMDAGNWSSTYPDYNNYTNAMKDANAAYQLALRYQISGKEEFAKAAAGILDAWANNNKGVLKLDGYTNNIPDPNEYLICIQGHQFANAAELLYNYDWSGKKKFVSWFKTTFYDLAHAFLENHHNATAKHYWLNWDLAAMTTVLSYGVLANNKSVIDEALNFYTTSNEHNGYMGNAIVALHNDPDKEGYQLGQCQESGRDQGHAMLDVALLGAFCQMATNVTGEDYFAKAASGKGNALQMAEYVAKYNLMQDAKFPNANAATDADFKYGTDIPFTAQTFTNESGYNHTAFSKDDRGNMRPTWELFYGYAQRKGKEAVYTEQWVEQVRNYTGFGDGGAGDSNLYGNSNGAHDQLGYGSLMYAEPAATKVFRVEAASNTYGVTKDYATMALALADVKANGEVLVLGDAAVNNRITFDKNVTVKASGTAATSRGLTRAPGGVTRILSRGVDANGKALQNGVLYKMDTNLTITFEGITFDESNTTEGPLIEVTNSQAFVLNNVTIKNSKSASSAGIINVKNGSLTLNNVNVESSTVSSGIISSSLNTEAKAANLKVNGLTVDDATIGSMFHLNSNALLDAEQLNITGKVTVDFADETPKVINVATSESTQYEVTTDGYTTVYDGTSEIISVTPEADGQDTANMSTYAVPEGMVKGSVDSQADNFVRSTNPTSSSDRTKEYIEVHTNADGSTDFVGLLSFQLPYEAKSSGSEIDKVQLRLVTKQLKGGEGIYLYGINDFTEKDATYESIGVSTVRSTTPVHKFHAKGEKGYDITSDGSKISDSYKNLDAWTNHIDLTDYVKSMSGRNLNLMITTSATDGQTKQFFSKERTSDMTTVATTRADASAAFNASAADLVPQLIIVYKAGEAEPAGGGGSTPTPETPTLPDGQDKEPITVPEGYTKDINTPTVDTYVRKGNSGNNGSKANMEIYTYADDTQDLDFVGLMAFKLPADLLKEGAKLEKAQLRLVSKRVKGSATINIYKLYSDFTESATYNDVETMINEAREEGEMHQFQAQGEVGKDVQSDAAKLSDKYKNIEAWTNKLDMTQAVYNSMHDDGMLRLAFASPDNSKDVKMFFTSEADVITNDVMKVAAKDLVPELTLVYLPGTGESTLTAKNIETTSNIDLFVRKGSTSDNSISDCLEVYTYNDGNQDIDFVSLLSFNISDDVAKARTRAAEGELTVFNATLRLVTKRLKGERDMNLYAFDGNFSNKSTYSELANNIAATRESGKCISFKMAGQQGKDILTDTGLTGDYAKSISVWTNQIDVSEILKNSDGKTLNIMLSAPDNARTSKQFFSSEANSFYNENYKTFVVPDEDLVPLLIISYRNPLYTDIEETIYVPVNNSEEIYDLRGNRVDKMGKGVYIVNGKKVLNK